MKHFLAIFLFALIFPVSSHADQNSDFQSHSVRLACGYSADVWLYVASTLGNNMTLQKESLPVLGDENARNYISFEDGSWLIAVEYFSQNSPKNNFTCIIDKGSKETSIDAVSRPVITLPKEIIASPIRSPKEA